MRMVLEVEVLVLEVLEVEVLEVERWMWQGR